MRFARRTYSAFTIARRHPRLFAALPTTCQRPRVQAALDAKH